MKALRLEATGSLDGIRLSEMPEPEPRKNEAVVRLQAASINHRDLFICQGKYAKIRIPVTLGSDGSGIVEAVGDLTNKKWIGQAVVIDPGLNWGDDPRAQSKDFRILGMPDDGTMAQKICVPNGNLRPKPEHLSFDEAAALPLAGVTAYRALMVQGHLKAGQVVLITGIGGGVASIALKLAVAAGAHVCVTSGSEAKIAAAKGHGAEWGFNYDEPGAWDRLAGQLPPVDLVLDGAGGDGFSSILNVVRPGGRIVVYGATLGHTDQVELRRIFWKQLTVQGSTMGSQDDFSKMISFVTQNRVHPIVDHVMDLSEARLAFERMAKSQQFGKLVLKP